MDTNIQSRRRMSLRGPPKRVIVKDHPIQPHHHTPSLSQPFNGTTKSRLPPSITMNGTKFSKASRLSPALSKQSGSYTVSRSSIQGTSKDNTAAQAHLSTSQEYPIHHLALRLEKLEQQMLSIQNDMANVVVLEKTIQSWRIGLDQNRNELEQMKKQIAKLVGEQPLEKALLGEDKGAQWSDMNEIEVGINYTKRDELQAPLGGYQIPSTKSPHSRTSSHHSSLGLINQSNQNEKRHLSPKNPNRIHASHYKNSTIGDEMEQLDPNRSLHPLSPNLKSFGISASTIAQLSARQSVDNRDLVEKEKKVGLHCTNDLNNMLKITTSKNPSVSNYKISESNPDTFHYSSPQFNLIYSLQSPSKGMDHNQMTIANEPIQPTRALELDQDKISISIQQHDEAISLSSPPLSSMYTPAKSILDYLYEDQTSLVQTRKNNEFLERNQAGDSIFPLLYPVHPDEKVQVKGYLWNGIDLGELNRIILKMNDFVTNQRFDNNNYVRYISEADLVSQCKLEGRIIILIITFPYPFGDKFLAISPPFHYQSPV